MPEFTEKQLELVTLFTKIIDLCNLFLDAVVGLFDKVTSVLITPLFEIAPRWLSYIVGLSPIFAPLEALLNWFILNPNTFIGQLTLLEIMFGSGFIFFVGYSVVKWFLDIVS